MLDRSHEDRMGACFVARHSHLEPPDVGGVCDESGAAAKPCTEGAQQRLLLRSHGEVLLATMSTALPATLPIDVPTPSVR